MAKPNFIDSHVALELSLSDLRSLFEVACELSPETHPPKLALIALVLLERVDAHLAALGELIRK